MCLVASAMLFTSEHTPRRSHIDITPILGGLCILAAVVFFIADLIFRRFILSTKKLWIVEGVLTVFIAVLILIINSGIK